MNAVKTISDKIISNISRVLYGKENELRLITAAYIAGGHVLLEDLPGLGKTTAARALAASVSGSYKRIQFTPDLLPSDITGINYFNSAEGRFVFRPGPVFANIVIADEINRATPRTQSALLECMAEGQVTVDAVTHRLDEPYLIIATENPVESQGVSRSGGSARPVYDKAVPRLSLPGSREADARPRSRGKHIACARLHLR